MICDRICKLGSYRANINTEKSYCDLENATFDSAASYGF